MRKTKIICTIGPSSESEEVFEKMCKAGLNVARLNFSHGTHEEHKKKFDMIKSVRERLNLPIAIMLDTKGPEYRIKTFKDGKAFLKSGNKFTFTTKDIIGDETCVSVNYGGLANDLKVGDTVLVNNGLLAFKVCEIKNSDVVCDVVTGGVISDRKSMNFPNRTLHSEYLSEQDKKDLLFGIENGADFIAASFVSGKEDIIALKEFVRENGGGEIGVIAKIENQSGIDNIEEISSVCEGIMIGRGDMGVEIPYTELPAVQKYLISKCRMLGKRVITATEMLESMITNPRPTRAEVSDVANAVYDGTSAVMLSGETAAGNYPVETVAVMSEIVHTTEKKIHYKKRFKNSDFEIKNPSDAVSHSTCQMAIDIGAKVIVACSVSGATVRMVSRFRAPIDIIGLTINKKAWYRLALSWGVIPVLTSEFNSTDVMFYNAANTAKELFDLQAGDTIVMTGGLPNGKSGNTNMIKIETI